ncbi:IclR family transcriptional regulator [Halobacteria archaeon AArc-m2/3/4]|uniref:IclR family transcriptional regulator n=1 Tax=Natronoglomus mannanivorans TaxID=2979990 RepID=A0ABT2QKP0_9EURY|nr:IclR family transcriptional regulator [Halobacteria archaeon AArc-m2/3/4]
MGLPTDGPADSEPRRTLKTTERSLEVLEFVMELDGGGVTQVAEGLGMSPSTAHGHLATLKRAEYLVQRGDQYHVSWTFLRYADFLTRQQEYQIATNYVEQLVQQTQCRTNFIVEEHGRGVYVQNNPGEQRTWEHSSQGNREYLHLIAAGKAILAALPDERVEQIIDKWGLAAKTPNTITDRDALLDELETIREQGFARNDEEMISGIRSVGGAVTDENDQVIGALSVGGPADRLTGEFWEEELPTIIRATTTEFEFDIRLS